MARALISGIRRKKSVSNRTSIRGAGTLLGISLARIFESGTKYVAAKPAFGKAVESSGDEAVNIAADGYGDAVELMWGKNK